MAILELVVQRFSTISRKDFHDVVADLQLQVGRPDIAEFTRAMSAAKSQAELEGIVESAVGSSGFIEFGRFNLGSVVRKGGGAATTHVLRILLGNPMIMARIARHVSDAASYTPVTVLLDARHDGVHLSYDRMTSLIAPYQSAEAMEAARELDAKVEALLLAVARNQVTSSDKVA
jgi:hypothetical protein